jgi:hypothetical protein
MARRRRYRRSTGFWRSGGNKLLLIALFALWLYVALQGDVHTAIGLAVVITIVETI